MSSSICILVFGDQTSGFDAGLRRLVQIRENSALVSFLEKAVYTLRNEASRLPASQREELPRFTSLETLLARLRELGPCPALDSALTCMHHLACFISYFEQGSQPYPIPSECYLIGLCTGQLAAAAISSCRTISDLILAGLEAIKIAFRVGLLTSETGHSLEQEADSSQSWAQVINAQESAVTETLINYCQEKSLPRCSRPYISAIASNAVTVSGPPQILGQFMQSPRLSSYQRVQVSIYSPYHASHLYDETDLDSILELESALCSSGNVPRIPIISSVTGELLCAPSYYKLLQLVIRELLVEKLRWDRVLQNCPTTLKDKASSYAILKYTVFPVATSVATSLIQALKSGTGSIVQMSDVLNKSSRSPLYTSLTDIPSTGRPEQSKIAIIGMSGRFPDSPDPEAFWKVLYEGLDVHRVVPKDRFDAEKYYDPSGKGKNTSKVMNGCWIPEPGLFDARFFSISPREAAQADPGQRLALITAYEALEQAGFVPNRTPSTQRDRVGIFYGMTSDDWREVNSGQNVDTYFIPGGNRAFTPGRINYFFKFSGPSYSVDTACSSSLAAIHVACNSLWKGDCDTALAGGTNVMTNPDNFAGLDRGGFLSHIGNCNAFDDSADGYCRADGVGTVILKRLEDAIADSDPIQAVIIGAYTNHSAEADSITRPHAGAQVAIFDKVLNESHVDPNDISYVEMHGTGTQIGDGLEMKSVLSVFAPHAGKRTNPLHLGSAKANVGHAESASGVTSLIKVLMMMEKNLIPPHCGIKTKINHTFPTDLSQRNVFIASKPVPWVRPEGGLRRVFLNNFSAAGGNTALLLEDAPNRTADGHEPRTWHLVAVSAKSASALTSNIHALLKYMDMNPNVSLPSLSYTTTARRLHYSYRSIIAGSDIQSISHGLASYVTGNVVSPTSSSSPSVAFSFTGQGSQYLGMGKQLFRNFSQFNRDMRRFDRIAQNQGFPSFIHLVDGSDEVSDISQVDPRALQVGTTCLQMALARLWASWGVVPTVVIGHSLGEYAALHAAGVISASDAIYLTGIRAQLLVKHCQAGTHTMLAVKASVSALQTHIQSTDVEIACVNSPTETVFSGTNSSIDHLSEKLNAINVKCTKLKIQFAFHSSQVDPILKEFQALAWGVTFHKPSIPVISPLTGELVTDCDVFGPAYLARHCRERVDFLSGIEAASHNKLVNSNTLWVEIGSHPVCSALVKAIIGPDVIALPSLRRNEDAWKTISETLSKLYLAGVPLKWDEYHRDFKNVEVLRLPSYCWDNKNHWIQYVHDWCLTKGDAPVSIPITKPLEAPASKLSTTTVQKIVEEVVKDGKLTITIESDIQRPDLHDVLKSHKVNGIALCPSSAYADIALTIADYLLSQSRPEIKGIAMDVCNMVVEKPLIARDLPSQLLRVTAAIEWTSKSTSLHFYSVDAEGRKTIDHARCTVQYADPTIWLSEWKRNAYFVHSRLEQLHKGVDEGDNHKMKRGIAYKLFDAVAEYGETYQGMKEVVINSAQLESTASVKFKAGEKDGTFYFSPYWIDSLGQLSGFTMNANEAVDTKAQVFINHGWDSMRCSKRLSQSALYTTYVRMQLVQGTLYAGDVYILEEDTIVAVYGGVKVDFSFTACFLLANADVAQFLGIPRKVLDSVLPPAGKASSQSKVVLKPAAPSALPASDGQIPIPSLSRSAPKRSATPTTVSRILAMVAEELGVQISELNDDVKFLDFGLDSLLSLTIIGKLREDLDLEVESTLFFDLPTVKDLKNFFSNREPSGQSTPDSYGETYSETNSSGLSTSNTFSESSVEMEFDVMDTIRHTLAEEIGVPLAELEDNVDLAELGLDSLMSLKVLSDLRENHDIDLDTEFFLKNCTLGAIQAHVGVKSPTLAVVPSAGKPTAPMIQQRTAKKPKATSVLLQGNLSMATKILWLFPDGSGSSTSYMAIPKIASDIAVFGLNCPYMKNAQGLMCGIDGLTVLYLKEIRRRQPHGPYFFGGWSAGGICAYDAAQVLQRSGETIARLILIDSPHPIGLEKLPPRLYEFFDSIKLFGEKPPPDWLFPHFLAFIDALDIYKAQPFASGKGPTTHVIWARDGVCKHPTDPRPDPRDDDPKEMKWLLNNRTDFGPNRWDQLVGKDSLVIETMDDANHFTMMEGQKAGELSAFLGRAMA